MEHKTCSKCEKNLTIDSFYKRAAGGAWHSACKQCEREMARDWYRRNRDKAIEKYKIWRENNRGKVLSYRKENRRKNYYQEIRRKYKIGKHQFDALYEKQSGACCICLSKFSFDSKELTPHVDHCHKTGKVRGLLCRKCNSVLGYYNDNPNPLQRAADYLKCHGCSAKLL